MVAESYAVFTRLENYHSYFDAFNSLTLESEFLLVYGIKTFNVQRDDKEVKENLSFESRV